MVKYLNGAPSKEQLAKLPKQTRGLVRDLFDPDISNRIWANSRLLTNWHEKAVPFLLTALEMKENREFGHQIVNVITKKRRVSWIPRLGRVLMDQGVPEKTREKIAAEFRKWSHPKTFPFLARTLPEEGSNTSFHATMALQDFAAKRPIGKITPKDPHYPFTLINFSEHPLEFAQLAEATQSKALRHMLDDEAYWKLYAKELLANKKRIK